MAVVFFDPLAAFRSPPLVPLDELCQIVRLLRKAHKLMLEQVFRGGTLEQQSCLKMGNWREDDHLRLEDRVVGNTKQTREMTSKRGPPGLVVGSWG